jgi:hypothetical protein
MDYRLCGSEQVEVLKYSGEPQGKYFPYRGFPLAFERRPIELDRLAEMPEPAKALLLNLDDKRLWEKGKGSLEDWLGRPIETPEIPIFDLWWHQFGGLPWLVQGPERITCANEKCSWSRRGWRMKILAVILNDPPSGLPMAESLKKVEKNRGHFNQFVQEVFHMCKNCLTIHVGNRCD